MHFSAISTEQARAYRSGALDANGQPPERAVSDGDSNPCRHCLGLIPAGAGMLVLAYRPFAAINPYAEVGPIFLCAEDCAQGGGAALPPMLDSPTYIVRGYSAADRIVYGTGGVIAKDRIAERAAELLTDSRVGFVHIRSARNNCFQCRVDR
jgi:hypothetical protein